MLELHRASASKTARRASAYVEGSSLMISRLDATNDTGAVTIVAYRIERFSESSSRGEALGPARQHHFRVGPRLLAADASGRAGLSTRKWASAPLDLMGALTVAQTSRRERVG